jgi:hypothetical protein
VGQQISPAVSTNTASSAGGPVTSSGDQSSDSLPGNGPTLFSRIWHAIF